MKMFISWIWWVLWSKVWKCQQLVLVYGYHRSFQILKIGHLNVSISHLKCQKYHLISVSKLSKFTQEILHTWIFLYFSLHPLLNQKPKRRKFDTFSTFFKEICHKLWRLNNFDKMKWFEEKKVLNSVLFMIFWLSLKSGRR